MSENHIICDQIASAVFDGAYHHVGVPRILREHFGFSELELPCFWDWMHRLGLIDKHIAEIKDFKWLGVLVNICQQLYHEFQWGIQLENLSKAAEDLDIAMRNLQNFSETRFANSKKDVFKNVFLMIKPILAVLEADVMRESTNRSGLEASDPLIRKRGLKARQLRGSFFNQQTLLLLAGIVDIYLIFGATVNVVQEYRLFPHQRYDKFKACIGHMKALVTHIDNQICSGNNCSLKHYHKARHSLKEDGTIQGVFIQDKYPVRAAGLNSHTRQAKRFEKDNEDFEDVNQFIPDDGKTNIFVKIEEQLSKFATKLSEDIENKTVDEEEVHLIKKTRDILDFSKIILKFRKQKLSVDIFAECSFSEFNCAAKALQIHSLDFISEEILAGKFRQYLHILVNLTESYSLEEVEELDPRELVGRMLSTKDKLFPEIQVILYIISVAASKSSTESILESYVSQYEYANDSRKNYGEIGVNDTFEIIKNGPNISKCDRVVKIALDDYFKAQKQQNWHFVTNKLVTVSKTMRRIGNESSPLVFMD